MTEQLKTKTFGIKLYPHEIEEFKRIVGEMNDGTTDRDAFLTFMDFYVNPPKKIQVDNPELIKKIEELSIENETLKKQVQQLEQQLENATSENAAMKEESENRRQANENRPKNIFEVNVHPVADYFLEQMAGKLKVDKGYILTDLFIKDLQNPRANNLPYIVPSSEIKSKLEEYKKAHPEEYKKN